MACVPGGDFLRGTDDGPDNTRPAARIWVDTFYMDTHEVSIEAYLGCSKRRKCSRAGPRYYGFDDPVQPITGVSWYDAIAFCAYAGKHLPTEAEWEKAARGPDGAMYPWGDEHATCEHAVIQDRNGRSCGVPKRGNNPERGRPSPVGSRPAGRYGLFDMMGNAWEWVWDAYTESYASCGGACAGPNPRGPCADLRSCTEFKERVVRGGSWYWDAAHATGVYRHHHRAHNDPFHHYGLRCAASVSEVKQLRSIEAPPASAGHW